MGVGSGDGRSAVVVGAGVFGAATADALAGRGWEVTLVEQYAPANSRSSSGDSTRLVRCGYGRRFSDDPSDDQRNDWYTQSAWRSLGLWRDLADELRRDLMINTGAVWFSSREDGNEALAEARLRAAGIPCERLDPNDLRDQFPSIAIEDLLFALYEPEACVVRASQCVHALVDRARQRGANVVFGLATPHPEGVLVNGEVLSADRVVWACGAWLGKLFPQWAPVTATRQDVFYWDSPAEWRNGLSWQDVDHQMYGFPDVDGLGVKAVTDKPGRPLDLDLPARRPEAGAEQTVREYLAFRFPALAAVGVLRTHVMHYEMTPDRGFLVGPLPEQDRVWLVGGGSGHGFKHAPALGAYVADLLDEQRSTDPWFAIARSEVAPAVQSAT